jgi:hypothetical protein
MLNAYFDESGIHEGSPICVVAGLVLADSAASVLSKKWSQLLSDYDLTHFHAKDFSALSGPFRGWHRNRTPAFSLNATELIDNALGYSASPAMRIGVGISSSDFFRLPVDERRWLTGGTFTEGKGGLRKWKRQGAPSKPYFLAFQHAVLDATKFTTVDTGAQVISHVDTNGKVNFIFDRQHEYEATALGVFSAMKEIPLSIKGRVGNITFESKMKSVLLQIADFMAYEAYCYLRSRDIPGRNRPSQQASALLTGLLGFNTRHVYIDSDALSRLLLYSPMTANKVFVPPDPCYPFDSLSKKPPVTSYRG